MKQSKVCTTTSEKFSEELSAVYQNINAYRNRSSSGDMQADKGKSRNLANIAAIAVLIIIGGQYAALYFLPQSTWGDSAEEIRLVLQLMVLFV